MKIGGRMISIENELINGVRKENTFDLAISFCKNFCNYFINDSFVFFLGEQGLCL